MLHMSDQMVNHEVKCLHLRDLTVQLTIWSGMWNAPEDMAAALNQQQ